MNQIAIRDIQHFLYCPHRWGLLKIDCAWAENYYVTKGNLLHKRVHSSEKRYLSPEKKALTTIAVYNDKAPYNIYGFLDSLELVSSESGIILDKTGLKYQLIIVEYKPTAPKDMLFHLSDAIQVFAQKICIDEIFKTNSQCVIYYSDTKQRIKLPFQSEYSFYDDLLKSSLNSMRIFIKNSEIPPIKKNQHCGGCSFKDLCMPSSKKYKLLRTQIKELID